MFRHPESLGHRQRALSAGPGLQGAGLDQRRLCLHARLAGRRGVARHDARASARAVGRRRHSGECRFRRRLRRRSGWRRRKRAAVLRDRRRGIVDRGFDRQSGQAALRFRSRGGARARRARGDRQGRRRRGVHRAQRRLHPQSPRSRRDDPAAQGLCRCRRRLPLCARHQDAGGNRGDRRSGRSRSRSIS